MKTAISIPDPLFEAAERLAARLGMSRSELYQHAVREYVHRHRHSEVRERLDEVYGSAPDRTQLDPVLEHMQLDSLDREDW
jgi:metal-responsive CopG/Arc/MetJ family transcriptional regulator